MVTSSLIRLHFKSFYRYTKRWVLFHSPRSFPELLGQLYRAEEEILSVALFPVLSCGWFGVTWLSPVKDVMWPPDLAIKLTASQPVVTVDHSPVFLFGYKQRICKVEVPRACESLLGNLPVERADCTGLWHVQEIRACIQSLRFCIYLLKLTIVCPLPGVTV